MEESRLARESSNFGDVVRFEREFNERLATKEPPESVAKVRIDTAVKPQWIDLITGELTGESVVDTVYAIKLEKERLYDRARVI